MPLRKFCEKLIGTYLSLIPSRGWRGGRGRSTGLDRISAHGINYAAKLNDAPVPGALHDATVMDTDGRIDQIAAQRPQPILRCLQPRRACSSGLFFALRTDI